MSYWGNLDQYSDASRAKKGLDLQSRRPDAQSTVWAGPGTRPSPRIIPNTGVIINATAQLVDCSLEKPLEDIMR